MTVSAGRPRVYAEPIDVLNESNKFKIRNIVFNIIFVNSKSRIRTDRCGGGMRRPYPVMRLINGKKAAKKFCNTVNKWQSYSKIGYFWFHINGPNFGDPITPAVSPSFTRFMAAPVRATRMMWALLICTNPLMPHAQNARHVHAHTRPRYVMMCTSHSCAHPSSLRDDVLHGHAYSAFINFLKPNLITNYKAPYSPQHPNEFTVHLPNK